MNPDKADNLYIEFGYGEGLPNPLALSNPERVFLAQDLSEVLPAIAQAEAAWHEGYIVAGFVSYEAAPAFEPALPPTPTQDFPLAYFAAFRQAREPRRLAGKCDFHVGPWSADTERGDYDSAVNFIRRQIARGEVYQVNLTYRLQAEFTGDPLAWYRQVAGGQHGAYSVFFHIGQYSLLSFSPELFFELENGHVTTRPMKGTSRRGYWPEKDNENYLRLAASEKERAENLMIVDLMRNDLGKIARIGSVRTEGLFKIHTLPTVYQMTSTVTADLDSEHGVASLMKSLFPSGSITGAPKISAMKIIQNLERSPRGVYCGAIGVLYPGKRALFNVAIRTAMVDHEAGIATFGVGGGITWDSRPESEFEETLAKSRFLTKDWPVFDLLETMRLEDGAYYLLDRHMNRLERSAAYFGLSVDRDEICRRLAKGAAERPTGPWRARLTAGQGGVYVDYTPLPPTSLEPKLIAFAEAPIETDSPFIFHKTTYRAHYEKCKRPFSDFFDVLLRNEAGRYTEFTIGNLVIERGGARITPPVSEGLLPGVFREELLDSGQLIEQPITNSDLRSANSLWLINSVRKWVPVSLSGERK